MLNFTDNTTYTTRTSSTRSSNYTTFTSKKQLISSNFIEGEKLERITAILGLFTTAVHNNKNYACCTLYKGGTYSNIVVNLNTGEVAEVGSIKEAKQEVNAIEAQAVAVETPAEEAVKETAPAAEEATEQPTESKSKKRSKKDKSNK